MNRLRLLSIAAGLIVAGLVLRLASLGLPLWARHFGGGLLWGAMVFLLVASLRPSSWNWAICVGVASVIAVVVELLRLYHATALDVFRATLGGQLLLGRIFSLWNLIVYEIGILAAAATTTHLVSRDTKTREGR